MAILEGAREKTGALLEGQLVDRETQVPIPLARIKDLTLVALYNAAAADSATPIRQNVVLITNGVVATITPLWPTYSVDPADQKLKLKIRVPASDQTIASECAIYEEHRALLHCTYDTGLGFDDDSNFEIKFNVENLRRVS